MTGNSDASRARSELFFASALFLFTELALIRWLPAQVLFLTFFTNTVLLASFLGLSLGCMASRHRGSFLPITAVMLSAVLSAGAGVEWLRRRIHDVIDVGGNRASPQMVYFGTEGRVSDVASFTVPIEIVAGFFFLAVAVALIGLGQLLGRRFVALPDPVQSYSLNVAGSAAGVLLFQACSSLLTPAWWFAIVAGGILYFLLHENAARRWWIVACACAPPLILFAPQLLAIGVVRYEYPIELWSPYYRINYAPKTRAIMVNLIGHQHMVSRDQPFPAYALPYLLNRDTGQSQFQDVLIIGAGSGNDVSRALQWTQASARIDAVEIDPVIQRLGMRNHPDRPYQDPRVAVHLDDGRNFMHSTDRKYDLIVFALVDSLVLHSSVSNLRLESYLFTSEAFADVRRCLKPDGMFVMYNYFRQGWILSRLVKSARTALGGSPLVLTLPQIDRVTPDQRADGFTLIFAGARSAAIERAFEGGKSYRVPAGATPGPSSANGFEVAPGDGEVVFRPAVVEVPPDTRVAEDAWPFLYLRKPMIPDLSWRGACLMGLLSLALLWQFGWRVGGEHLSRFNLAMLLLGAGFMLLETKAVVHLALAFGSTWIVNTIVFSAILVMILLANLWVAKINPRVMTPYYVGLFAALALNMFVPLESVLGIPQPLRALAAGTLALCPFLFSGVIFATLFKTAARPEQAIAYNTVGAILGGLAETVSLLIGFKYLVAVAGLIYLAAFVLGVPGQLRRVVLTRP